MTLRPKIYSWDLERVGCVPTTEELPSWYPPLHVRGLTRSDLIKWLVHDIRPTTRPHVAVLPIYKGGSTSNGRSSLSVSYLLLLLYRHLILYKFLLSTLSQSSWISRCSTSPCDVPSHCKLVSELLLRFPYWFPFGTRIHTLLVGPRPHRPRVLKFRSSSTRLFSTPWVLLPEPPTISRDRRRDLPHRPTPNLVSPLS